MSNNGWT